MKRFLDPANFGKLCLCLVFLATDYAQAVVETWQHVLPDVHARQIGILQEQFVAVTGMGDIYASGSGLDWNLIREEADPKVRYEAILFADDGLTVFTSRETTSSTKEFEIRFSEDLVEFETLYSTVGNRNDKWNFFPIRVAGAVVIELRKEGLTEFFYSNNNRDWESVLTFSGQVYTLYRMPDGSVILGDQIWVRSDNGRDWVRHYATSWSYAPFGGGFVGVDNKGILTSEEGYIWAVTQELPPGPRLMAASANRIIAGSYRKVFMSTDGLNWETVDLPELPVPNHPYTFTYSFAEGSFWIHRIARFKPLEEVPDDLVTEDLLRSEDGLIWEFASLPREIIDESTVVQYVGESIPEEAELIRQVTLNTAVPVSLENNGIRVSINQIPDSHLYGLYQQVDFGEPEIVNSSWGLGFESSYPFNSVLQVVELNGRFLARNSLHYLGLLDPSTTYLGQTQARMVYPTQETSISIYWDAVEGAEHYKVHRFEYGTDPGAAVLLGETSATEWVDSSPELKKGVTYAYTVSSHSPSGESGLPGKSATGRLWSILDAFGAGLFHEASGGAPLYWADPDWLDYVYFKNYPWIWSLNHGWWYLSEPGYGFWAFDFGLGWIWSQQDLYPSIYRENTRSWLYYLKDSSDPRWFYDLANAQWLTM